MIKNFEELVKSALLLLPLHIRNKMDNVSICIEKNPTEEHYKKLNLEEGKNILGLYQGIPQNQWGRGMGNNLPDKIIIFEEPIKKITSNENELKTIIRNVVWHEIAHHFGFDEEEVKKLEDKWKNKEYN